jgi:ribonuclease R
VFVQLDDLLIDGLVHVTALKRDYYHFDPAHHRLVGELTGRHYRLGDRLMVEVVRVDMEDRKIDFDLVGVISPGERPESATDPDEHQLYLRHPCDLAAANAGAAALSRIILYR